jgi:protein-tyrosine phosphatase
MDRISSSIFLGSSSDALYRLSLLKSNGITAILNVAKDLDNPFASHRDFYTLHVGLGDGDGNPLGLLYSAVLSLSAMVDAGHIIMVHCHEGRSRSPSVVAAYLVAKNQYNSIEEALDFLHSQRSVVNPEPGIVEDFKRLDMELIREVIK